jgi:hypothetical protein
LLAAQQQTSVTAAKGLKNEGVDIVTYFSDLRLEKESLYTGKRLTKDVKSCMIYFLGLNGAASKGSLSPIQMALSV